MPEIPALAALGFRVHSGWACMVMLTGPLDNPSPIGRRRIELASRDVPGFPQPYHAAEPLDLAAAARLIDRCRETARQLANQEVSAAVAELRASGHRVAGCGMVLASGRPLPELARILASHALIHPGAGAFVRAVIGFR